MKDGQLCFVMGHVYFAQTVEPWVAALIAIVVLLWAVRLELQRT
jgi:hypothetical protein